VKALVKQLTEAYGPSGREEQIRSVIEGLIRDHVDEMRTDALGNLIALKKGTGGGKRVLVAAHMDEIGLMVTYVDAKGFLRVSPLGGVFLKCALGQRVVFADGTVGTVAMEKWLQSNDTPTLDKIFVDVGATSPDELTVGIGDAAAFCQPFVDRGDRLIAKAMDDRACCAIELQALLEMPPSPHDVYFVFTSQEEVGTRGATVAAFALEPDVALSVDVTAVGDTPEASPMAVSLGAGPAIKVMDRGMLTHPGVKQWMVDTAEKIGVPYQFEVLMAGSTDASAMQVSRAGVPAGCISLPCRHVHTPSEMVDVKDLRGSVDLLKALLASEIDF
jgi:putative aminopeptidase FrvX